MMKARQTSESLKHAPTTFEPWGSILAFFVIVAVIYSIVISSTRATGGDATKTFALSRIKQTTTAIHIYAADYNERFPSADKWMDLLAPYIKDVEILRSPLATPDDKSDYGIAFRKEYGQKKAAEFSDSEYRAMVFDSTLLSRNANSGLETLPKPGRYGKGDRRGNIVGFVEGHAKYVQDQKLKELAADGKPLIR